MKILVNASTLIVGGGIQVGVSFIEQVYKNDNFTWYFIVSDGIFKNLNSEIKSLNNVLLINFSPAKIFSGRKSRQLIKKKVLEFNPDLIYSIGFPSYINFNVTELGRYTNPWEINKKPLPWKLINSPLKKITILLGIYYRQYWARKADFLETQTVAASQGIYERVKFSIDKIFVIPNSPNSIFLKEGKLVKSDNSFYNKNIAFCLSAPYEHKNLDLVPEVARDLKHFYNVKMKFILTIPFESDLWIYIKNKSVELGVEELIENVGKIKLKDCISYYSLAKIVFLPSLLEIFSATYVEAMSMKTPIVTTDLSFARDNCKTGAIFFEPSNSKDAADKIYSLIKDKSKFNSIVKEATRVLNSYPTIENKYENIYYMFKTIIQNEKK